MDLGTGDCFDARVAGNVADDDIVGSMELAAWDACRFQRCGYARTARALSCTLCAWARALR
jgi:hypothetical protein